jgi:hypothetical protein
LSEGEPSSVLSPAACHDHFPVLLTQRAAHQSTSSDPLVSAAERTIPMTFRRRNGWLMRLANIIAIFQDNPCLEGFSSEPDEMPLIEAWWLTIIACLQTSAFKASVSVSI